ncbi:Uncharacterised protein [Paenibacillus thiaminolyticus]|nr:Uncharacterised protein [Paenibacillus thiaminolyticus]
MYTGRVQDVQQSGSKHHFLNIMKRSEQVGALFLRPAARRGPYRI